MLKRKSNEKLFRVTENNNYFNEQQESEQKRLAQYAFYVSLLCTVYAFLSAFLHQYFRVICYLHKSLLSTLGKFGRYLATLLSQTQNLIASRYLDMPLLVATRCGEKFRKLHNFLKIQYSLFLELLGTFAQVFFKPFFHCCNEKECFVS